MIRRFGPSTSRGHYNKKEHELIAEDGRPFEPPKPNDIEGRPAVGQAKGEDPLLDALIRCHPERDPVHLKLSEDNGIDNGTDAAD